MSKIEVNEIDKQNGSTLTLGGSGTAVTLASGATQSGFGRTGTVDWQTSIKTSSFTAVSGEGYFVNTTSGAITVTLPASPSVGDIVAIKDYANTFDTNNLTIARNGSNLSGEAVDAIISVEGQAITLIYGDATKGWQSVYAATEADLPKPSYVVATGGTVTTVCTNFKVHTFTGPGTFTVTCAGSVSGSNTVDYMVVAGGGGGGFDRGGGGGAGGFRESSGAASGCYTASPLGACVSALPVSAQAYPITVGGGGTASNTGSTPTPNGSQSVFSTITSTGGGGAGNPGPHVNGRPGGSGGGARDDPATGGSGNTPPVSPPQGKDGGSASGNQNGPGGGGGGATQAGFDGQGNPSQPTMGDGGAGATTSITGSPTAYAGGGGSGGGGTITDGGVGGTGGGANGAPFSGSAGSATANTGGGGGAGNGGPSQPATSGGSGIVVIRYKFQ